MKAKSALLLCAITLQIYLLGGSPSLSLAADSTMALDHGIKILRDMPYVKGGAASQSLDLYLPANHTGKLPLIILIHGGGWSAGDKDSFGGPCLDFVRHGYAAASLNYRLSQQALFPAPVVDCKAAVRWLRAHAVTYGLDTRRFVVGGHSAGGHLAAFLGVTNGRKEFDQGDNLDVRSDVQAVLWFAGVGDFVARVKTPGYESEADPHSGQSMLIGGAVSEHQDKAMAASPITYVSRKAAPFIFYHGDSDRLVPPAQAVAMDKALRAQGVYSELHLMPGADHGGPGFFSLSMLHQIDIFLAKTLKLRPRQRDQFLSRQAYRLFPVSAPQLVLSAKDLAGAPVGIAPPSAATIQQWSFVAKGNDIYAIHPMAQPTLALTVMSNDTKDGTRLTLAPDQGLPAQLWLIARDAMSGTYALSPQNDPARAIDDFSGNATPDAVIDIWSYNGADQHLQWIIAPVG